MISKIKNNIFTRILCGIMALYLLNISVDATDPNPDYIPEDLSINDQESIVELVIEKVLGYEDAIGEYDDHDTEDHNNKSGVEIDLFILPTIVKNDIQYQLDVKTPLYFDKASRLLNGFKEIDSPPPKV